MDLSLKEFGTEGTSEARTFPSSRVELERWARKSDFRSKLALGYAICFTLGALERSRSASASDYRWISNTLKAIVSGVPGLERQLDYEVSEPTYTFESAPLRQILTELLSAGLLDLSCQKCGEVFSSILDEKISPWDVRAAARNCKRCGEPFDSRFAIFRLSGYGLEWITLHISPLFERESDEMVIMTKTMVLGTRLLYRNGRDQFDFASDTAVKLSALRDLK